MEPIDVAALSRINASIKEPVTVAELIGWLTGMAPVVPGKASHAVYTFFAEVPQQIRDEFVAYHGITQRQLDEVNDKHVRHRRG